MHRYVFRLSKSEVDVPDLLFADDESARAQARVVACELAHESAAPSPDECLEVLDSSGRLVHREFLLRRH
jgi:hypothetical protein